MTAPKVGIKNLVKAGWLVANTSDVLPSFSTGWYDRKNVSPQVTFTDPILTPVSGGQTGFFGMKSNGTPSKYWDGSVKVNLWVTREALETAGVNPKQYIYAMRVEIARILLAGYGSVSGLDYVSWMGGFEKVEAAEKPVVYRFIGEVGFGYLT